MNKINKIFVTGMACCGLIVAFTSCSKDELTTVSPAEVPSSITLNLSDELLEKIYVDDTGAQVLPMLKGETVSLTYTLLPEDATFKDVVWTSSNETYATVADGVVNAVSGNGYSMVQVAPEGVFSGSGINAALKVQVSNELTPATAITIAASETKLYEGETAQLTATVAPSGATYKTVRWSSSNTSVATVDIDGVVTAVSAPQVNTPVTITATAIDGSGVTAEQELIVRQIVEPEKVTIDAAYDVASGYACAINERTLTLPFTTYPEDCTTSLIEWSSSDETIATVSNGVVTFNQEGYFGEVAITATCPKTGETSTVTLNLAAGLFRETFHNPDHYSWYNSNQSGNGTSSSHEWHDGYITITTYTVNETTQRGDIKCWETHTWLHAGNYPILAFRMDDVAELGDGITVRNINVDAVGQSTSGKEYKAIANGNNKWRNLYLCSDGSSVFIYDLSVQACGTGGLMPTNEVVDFKTMQVKYADMKNVNHQVQYNLYWVQTFKSMDDLDAYIASEGLTYTKLK